MSETIEQLERRRELLREIKALVEEISLMEVPDEEEMKAVAGHLENLTALQELEPPDEEETEAVAKHLSNLEQIDSMEVPGEEEMEQTAKHLAALEAIQAAA